MTTIKFVTWNMSHAVKRSPARRLAAWRHLRDLGADIAIVQEAGRPITGAVASVEGSNPEGRDWVTAIVSYGPGLTELQQPIRPRWDRQVEFRIPDAARPGTLALATVNPPDGKPILAVSLYGRLRYADQSILRAASDLLPIFDTPLGRRVIVAGDLNIHTHSNDPAERARAGPILSVLESFGLRDLVREAKNRRVLIEGPQLHREGCPCGLLDCSHVRTHRHPQHKPGAMANNDYIFATDELLAGLESVSIMNGDQDPAWPHSDHAPIGVSIGA